ncbi:MAG: polysaccharide pyruvyl transferase family protein [Aliishimia sp.]
MSAPLSLFWWKAVPNFGDAISQTIVAHMSGRIVEHKSVAKADMFAIGSILQVARRKLTRQPRTDGIKPWVWGSGVLMPLGRDVLDHVQIALVRGPVTAALLGVNTDQFGDPGLLADEVYEARPRHDKIGIVPHHTLVDDAELLAVIAKDPALVLIDPRDDAGEVCRQISACAHVFASSLHGLIVADAYGVGSTWLDPVGQGRLKYYDYAASIGRDLTGPVSTPDIPACVKALKEKAIPYSDGIARARHALKANFPAELKAGPKHAAPAAA